MSLIDIILIVLLLIGFLLGFKDGFVRKIIGLAGFALAVYLSIKFADPVGKSLEEITGIEFYMAQILAGFLIFILIIFITAIIKRVVHPFDKVNNIINQLLGGIFGIIQILFFLSAVLYILNIFNVPDEESKKSSLLYKSVYNIIPLTINYLKNYTDDSKKIIKDYIKDKDSINVNDSTR